MQFHRWCRLYHNCPSLPRSLSGVLRLNEIGCGHAAVQLWSWSIGCSRVLAGTREDESINVRVEWFRARAKIRNISHTQQRAGKGGGCVWVKLWFSDWLQGLPSNWQPSFTQGHHVYTRNWQPRRLPVNGRQKRFETQESFPPSSSPLDQFVVHERRIVSFHPESLDSEGCAWRCQPYGFCAGWASLPHKPIAREL